MTLTIEQHLQVYQLLANEEKNACKAVEKAQLAADNAPYGFGGISVDCIASVVLLNLRAAQYEAARIAAVEYFDAYIKDAA